MELLAATDKDQFTAIGSERCPSFTMILVEEMKRILKHYGAVTIPDLARSMASARVGLAKQRFGRSVILGWMVDCLVVFRLKAANGSREGIGVKYKSHNAPV